MAAVKEDMQVVGVRLEDTENRVNWKTVIRCGNAWKAKSREEKKKKNFAHTWTSLQLQSRLDSRDCGDDGSVRHDGPVHIHFLGGGNRRAGWQSIMGAGRLFHIQQLEEEFLVSRYLSS